MRSANFLLLPDFWKRRKLLSYLLLPFSLIYRVIAKLRRLYWGIFQSVATIPVVVVGNITVGGTGKTQLVIYLVELLKKINYRVGVVSRGYGRKSKATTVVDHNSDVRLVGDEPKLIFDKTGVVVVISTNRVKAVKLAMELGCNIVISDDGLQHYCLGRDLEVAVIDYEFGFGNGFCLPSGPLREPIKRLAEVDFIVYNFNTDIRSYESYQKDYGFYLGAVKFRNLVDCRQYCDPSFFKFKVIHAIAGIGRPEKFFNTLRSLGLEFVMHSFPDHYEFRPMDLIFGNEEIVIMTEKDSVKCKEFARDNCWFLETEIRTSYTFDRDFLARVMT